MKLTELQTVTYETTFLCHSQFCYVTRFFLVEILLFKLSTKSDKGSVEHSFPDIIKLSVNNVPEWWWCWIVFVVWLTDERHLALFPAGTIARLSWIKLCNSNNHYTTGFYIFVYIVLYFCILSSNFINAFSFTFVSQIAFLSVTSSTFSSFLILSFNSR